MANKGDLYQTAVITEERGRKFAEEKECVFYTVSCKTGDGIKEMFEDLAKRVAKGNNKSKNITLTQKKPRTLKEFCCGSKSKSEENEKKENLEKAPQI